MLPKPAFLICVVTILLSPVGAQTNTSAGSAPPSGPGPRLTLNDAIRLAKSNAPDFQRALAEAGVAREDRVQARAAMLPSLAYTTGAIYTKPNGTDTAAFIAANGPREYLSQGAVHETLSLASAADYRRARALEALARARAEIAARGLISTITRDFYDVIITQQKYENAQAAADDARKFVDLSRKLENGGEVAHSDVVKAQLQANDRERDVEDARLAAEQAKLGLAVLIFPTFTADYDLVNDLGEVPTLPEFTHIQDLAAHNNPEIAAANAAMQAAQNEVSSAFAGHLPSLSFDYFYGIDANHYATYSGDIDNLGYQAVATFNLPIFDWGATRSKIKQAQLRRDAARVELSAAQRAALANLRLFYNQAKTARTQIDLLKQSADLAAESLRLTVLRYEGGEATALEVVDAQNASLLAQNNYAEGAGRYRAALANLQTLTGTF
ncbi:MAG TPA: TolC family protein [Terriglobales bacterium]|nr:TolC family protein [Terriglobales bacterium]